MGAEKIPLKVSGAIINPSKNKMGVYFAPLTFWCTNQTITFSFSFGEGNGTFFGCTWQGKVLVQLVPFHPVLNIVSYGKKIEKLDNRVEVDFKIAVANYYIFL